MSDSTWNRIREIVMERCWKGYKPVKGKKPYSKGSCEKVTEGKDDAWNKMLHAIDAAFSPEKMKEMDAKHKAAQDADPKFQEWKKKRAANQGAKDRADAAHQARWEAERDAKEDAMEKKYPGYKAQAQAGRAAMDKYFPQKK